MSCAFTTKYDYEVAAYHVIATDDIVLSMRKTTGQVIDFRQK